tara:strand:- start:1649 stop:1888 length:240 start_codon:yes stop_codon:yes gene_type:complete
MEILLLIIGSVLIISGVSGIVKLYAKSETYKMQVISLKIDLVEVNKILIAQREENASIRYNIAKKYNHERKNINESGRN